MNTTPRDENAHLDPESGREPETEPDSDLAEMVAGGRHEREADSIDPQYSSDREGYREQLHHDATRRQANAAASDRKPELGFARQMVQLVFIPAMIVAVVMGVWAIIITLGGREPSLSDILDSLNEMPHGETAGAYINIPKRQNAFRNAVELTGRIDADDLTEEDRVFVRDRLIEIGERHLGTDDAEALTFLLKTIGSLADPATLDFFRRVIEEGKPDARYAAALGLYGWQMNGDISDVRPIVPAIRTMLGTNDESRTRALAAAVLAGAASPDDQETRDSLAEIVDSPTIEDRDLIWNAGCSLAALGDERGHGVVSSLLDREWLARQPDETTTTIQDDTLRSDSQDKVMLTVLNILVRFDTTTGRHAVRVHDDTIWSVVESLADNDPSDTVREVAGRILDIRNADDDEN
jgi:hypothetical protein